MGRKSLALYLLVCFSLLGCDTSIDPVREKTFSIYGYLSLDSEKSFVRVKPLNRVVGEGGDELQDVDVILRNETDGGSYALNDSVVTFVDNEDSVTTHNYWTGETIKPETKYELSVRREGEVITSAYTTTPTGDAPSVRPDSGNCLTGFNVRFEGAKKLPVRIVGSFRYQGQRNSITLDKDSIAAARNPENGDPFIILVPERDLLHKRIPKKDQPDTGGMFDNRYVPRCLDLDAPTIELRYLLSRDWSVRPPDSATGSAFVQYIENPRIGNGHGFFGSITGGQVSVRVDTADTLGSRGPPGGSSIPERSSSCLPPCSP